MTNDKAPSSKFKVQIARLLLVLLILMVVLGSGVVRGTLAQAEDDAWSEPVNLSHSGAADQPRIVAAPDGTLQVFWWDRFDGLMTARFDGETWSDPTPAPILAGGEAGSSAVGAMPYIMADASGWAHAFWLEGSALMHSQMPVGGPWSEPEVVADSAAAFDVAAAPSGGLTLAYIRTLHSADSPAGVYVRRTAGRGGEWGEPVAVYETIYFRLLTPENAYMRVAESGSGTIHLVWEDPRQGEALYTYSTGGGFSRSEPESLGEPDERPANPRVLALPDGSALRLWEAAGMGGCTLHQQRLADFGETLRQASGQAWSTPQRVLEGMSNCPQGERFWLQDGWLLWLWGEGSSTLTLAAWDAKTAQWSEPRSLSFRFQDPETESWVTLSDLHAALASGVLAVVGIDSTTGEVWATIGQVDALELVFAPPSPWSTPVRLSQEGAEAGWPAVALDADGGVHAVWSQTAVDGGPGTALLYARWDGSTGLTTGGSTGRWSRAVEVVGGASGQEMARQPALVADAQGLLHLVWSGGQQGQIVYSRVALRDAAWSGAWSPPQVLSHPGAAGSWPQMGADVAGRLYVVYAVPLNEGRGIYVTRSDDRGETWSEPEVVFDAEAAGWAIVDHPTLAVAPDGTLYVAWVQGALPCTWPPQGVYYARSDSGGDALRQSPSAGSGQRSGQGRTEPLEVAGPGHDWPRLALAGGQVHLFYAEADGGVWHRWAAAEAQAGSNNGWSTATRLPGWEGVVGPFGLAADGGGTLHLAGVDGEGETLLYSAWDGNHWSAAETFSLGSEVGAGLGVVAATWPQGGQLAVVVQALTIEEGKGAAAAVFFTARTIPSVEVLPPPMPAPTPTPVVTPSPTPQPTAVPSPTPDLTSGPPYAESSMSPLILSGGLAAVIVLGVLATWGFWRRRE